MVEQCRPHKDAKQSVKLLLCSTPDNEGFPSTPRSLSLSQLHQVRREQEMNTMGTQAAISPTCIREFNITIKMTSFAVQTLTAKLLVKTRANCVTPKPVTNSDLLEPLLANKTP